MDLWRRSGVHANLPATSSTITPPNSSDSTNLPRKKDAPIHQCQGIPGYCPGLAQRASKVQEMLTRVAVVGIVGIGGIGKSTIAKQVFNNISSEFEYTCFVENAKDLPRPKQTMAGLKDELLGKFYQNGVQVNRHRTGWHHFWEKKILLVMDDVDSETEQLNFLPDPDLSRFEIGSRFIITSRKPRSFQDFGRHPYEVYNVDLLEDHEAQMLLSHCAFGEEHVFPVGIHHFEDYVGRVVKRCHGLPLTLEVTGCSLRKCNSEIRFWEETIAKLGRAEAIDEDPDERVQASLQVSIDCLPPEERELFIDAAIYFYEQPLEEAMAAWSTAYKSSDTAWEKLLERSLVKKVRKGVWVHEQLRDLAKKIAKSEVVCLSDEDADKAVGILNTGTLNTHTVRTHTHSLRLSYNYVWSGGCCIEGPPELFNYFFGLENDFIEEGRRPLQIQSLDKLENLKYLEVTGIPCKGTTKNFPKNISLLKWKLGSRILPQINLEELNNLAVLIVHQATIPKGFSEQLGNLIKLRILSLRELKGLDCLPENFGDLSMLKCLDLGGRYDLDLGGRYCLDLGGLDSLSRIPSSVGNLSALEDLNLKSLGIVELPETFGDLSSLVTLSIERCDGLVSLPCSFGCLSLLKKLVIDSCEKLKELQDSFGNLTALTDLRIHCNTTLERLPASFGDLSALENLELSWCTKLKSLPNNFGRLGALKRLTITDAHQLEELSDSFGDLPALTYLKLKSCRKLERLPESFGRLIALEILELEECEELKSVPELGNLSSLTRLEISGCKSLESLPELLRVRFSH